MMEYNSDIDTVTKAKKSNLKFANSRLGQNWTQLDEVLKYKLINDPFTVIRSLGQDPI